MVQEAEARAPAKGGRPAKGTRRMRKSQISSDRPALNFATGERGPNPLSRFWSEVLHWVYDDATTGRVVGVRWSLLIASAAAFVAIVAAFIATN